MKTVKGKRILITGAAMGMGKIYAELSVQENASALVLWDVNSKVLLNTAKQLRSDTTKIFTDTVDVSDLEKVRKAVSRIEAQLGGIDILINNAGIVKGKYFWEHDPKSDIETTMAINTLGPMYSTRFLLPKMLSERTGEFRIVNISSAAGLISNPKMSVYCASKWAETGWSDSLRLELLQAGYGHIKVTTVNPAYISTGMFEGVKGMLFTPILTPEYVTSKVWNAMKKGKPRLLLPWTIYLSNALRGILPISVFDWIADKIFGVYKTMEGFKGRS
ncbi:SDR family NAD(P)-dependent oxidoreductase [Leptospira sp. WS58.C1]|uniref:SDR family NAD(P)-dependent oxidoreductase n=1 Tax=Leptospira TaxID=171 RepID=UPI0002BF95C8|nr:MULTISPECIES: SDR family NAD(P)-dependent oxidoreductase [unclassified Leptospira]EMK00826.1 KR domain protein [Leptospira sp. B5-022]MCR1794701.1 SDR family NAD(P)-dependent oxidoreductase [Leptospira sp. id769339]